MQLKIFTKINLPICRIYRQAFTAKLQKTYLKHMVICIVISYLLLTQLVCRSAGVTRVHENGRFSGTSNFCTTTYINSKSLLILTTVSLQRKYLVFRSFHIDTVSPGIDDLGSIFLQSQGPKLGSLNKHTFIGLLPLPNRNKTFILLS